ncbi:pyridoxamine 5'-phosphate oxidase family protein [Glycomyces sp. NPDC049804]|uniref:pyridoxamine 5'-phosphate oxidase family protein n=1 Tax=Glycomyces sp. NPDC049804 TaxID=3154363 RepID=UPI00343578F6
MDDKRVPTPLNATLALGLLGQEEFGRVAFISEGRPTIRPLNHVLVEGLIIVHTGHHTAFAQAVLAEPGLHVAYQADAIDKHTRLGWSVLVAGTASDVTDSRRTERLGPRVHSWLQRPLDTAIAIRPHKVTGLRLTIEH